MKILCGTDIIEISRIQKAIDTKGKKFLEKIYTEKEIKYCESKKENKYEHYAARFAAKEAVFNAISSKTRRNIEWKKIEIINTYEGRPEVNILYDIKDVEKIDVSMSHCKEFATANAIAVYK